MEKPVSLSVKEWIIRNMSTRIGVSERIIETVINDQFEGAIKAMNTCDTLEFAGFGKFYFNRKKAGKKLERLVLLKEELTIASTDVSLTAQKRHTAALKLITVTKVIEDLTTKLYENKPDTDIRGVEESYISPEVSEENN